MRLTFIRQKYVNIKEKNMKYLKMMALGIAALAATMSLQSCLDDDDDENNALYYPNAVVTLKPQPSGLLLQLDDSTTLWAVNMKQSPYGSKELRAFVNYREPKESEQVPQQGTAKNVFVNWIDTIRTKPMAADMGAQNAATYGTDPVEIVRDWATVVEDGYLTIRFRTYFGNGTVHVLNLVRGSSPYEVVLYHDAKGDTGGRTGDGMIAFRLNELPDTHGQEVDLTLKWESFSGPKSATFKYRSR